MLRKSVAGKGVWRALGDDFRTFLIEFVSSVPQTELPSAALLGKQEGHKRPRSE
jgi:hypothetical protein